MLSFGTPLLWNLIFLATLGFCPLHKNTIP
uniref:Uncharacterized protein n=1 Tax=Rhizophora mucronata TaxID=61149 RepID=A0A2P2NRJ1_RHIMU